MFKKEYLGQLLGIVALLCLAATRGMAAECRQSGGEIVLWNQKTVVAFDELSGALRRLENCRVNDNYLKRKAFGGNPYRLIVGPTELPENALAGIESGPAAPEDALGGECLDAAAFRLDSWEFHPEAGRLEMLCSCGVWRSRLTVSLPEDGDELEFSWQITNLGERPTKVIFGFPFLTGLQLGDSPADDLGLNGVFSGRADEAAWINSGGAYGWQCSIQAHCVYDKRFGAGLTVFPEDVETNAKILRRLPEGGLTVLYYPAREIAPGETAEPPPARVIVHQGSWITGMRRYGEWFRSAAGSQPLPEAARRDSSHKGFWVPRAADAAAAGFTFNTLLGRDLLPSHLETMEWAMYWDGMRQHPESYGAFGPDGEYFPREDLGGKEGMRQCVERANAIGRSTILYVAGVGLHDTSDYFKTHDMGVQGAIFKQDGTPLVYLDHDYFMCPGYEPWQDQIAKVAARLVRDYPIDGIRLDEMGVPRLCFNPNHHHETPFDYLKWERELFRKVRTAVDAVRPGVVIYTEFPLDYYSITNNGYLQMNYAGRNCTPMRVAFPHYQAISCHAGAFESALEGYTPALRGAGRSEFLGWKPANYITGAGGFPGPELRFDEVLPAFREVYNDGQLEDVQLEADAPDWTGRFWRGERFWLLPGGPETIRPFGREVAIHLPEVPAGVRKIWRMDLRTLELRETQPSPSGDLVQDVDFAIFLLATARTPSWLTTTLPTTVLRGETLAFRLEAISLSGEAPARQAEVEIPGLLPQRTVELPTTIFCEIPADVSPGNYYLKVTGDEVLELRRWFAVKPAETVVTWVGDGRTGVDIADALQRKLGDRYAVQAVGGPEVTLRKPDWMPWWSENLYAEMKTTIPDIVVIALGSNDSRPQFWDAARLEADAAELVNELRQNDSHPVVLLALPPPVFGAGGQGFDAEVLQNEVIPIIRGVAEETDAELVDFNAPFKNRRELFPDGVHLGAEGQEMLLELAAKRIREVPR